MAWFGNAVARVFGGLGWAGETHRAIEVGDIWGPWEESTDRSVDGDKALRLIPVYAAVKLIADMLASLPIDFVEKVAGVRRPIDDPPWYDDPDPRISRFDWLFQLAASVLLRGNAYGLVIRVRGVIVGIRWLHPDRVRVDESGRDPITGEVSPWPLYYVGGSTEGRMNVKQGGDILHIRGFIMPGSVLGLNPIELFRIQLETARGADEYGHDWFDDAVMPSGILKNDRHSLDPDKTAEAKRLFVASVKRGEPVALDQNWSWEQLSVKPADAEWLSSIKASATMVAVMFRVDPDDIGGETGSSMTYSTVEGNQRKFNIRTLMSWAVRFEEAFRAILGPGQQMKFNLDALARPDTLGRAKVTTEELNNGTTTLGEARTREDRTPLTEADLAFWREHYRTTRSQSESESQSKSTTVEED